MESGRSSFGELEVFGSHDGRRLSALPLDSALDLLLDEQRLLSIQGRALEHAAFWEDQRLRHILRVWREACEGPRDLAVELPQDWASSPLRPELLRAREQLTSAAKEIQVAVEERLREVEAETTTSTEATLKAVQQCLLWSRAIIYGEGEFQDLEQQGGSRQKQLADYLPSGAGHDDFDGGPGHEEWLTWTFGERPDPAILPKIRKLLWRWHMVALRRRCQAARTLAHAAVQRPAELQNAATVLRCWRAVRGGQVPREECLVAVDRKLPRWANRRYGHRHARAVHGLQAAAAGPSLRLVLRVSLRAWAALCEVPSPLLPAVSALGEACRFAARAAALAGGLAGELHEVVSRLHIQQGLARRRLVVLVRRDHLHHCFLAWRRAALPRSNQLRFGAGLVLTRCWGKLSLILLRWGVLARAHRLAGDCCVPILLAHRAFSWRLVWECWTSWRTSTQGAPKGCHASLRHFDRRLRLVSQRCSALGPGRLHRTMEPRKATQRYLSNFNWLLLQISWRGWNVAASSGLLRGGPSRSGPHITHRMVLKAAFVCWRKGLRATQELEESRRLCAQFHFLKNVLADLRKHLGRRRPWALAHSFRAWSQMVQRS